MTLQLSWEAWPPVLTELRSAASTLPVKLS